MANTNDSSDPLHAKNKAWSGRFSEPVADFVLRYTASVNFDKRMAKADINGSLAHAAMLEKAGVISEQDLADIRRGMKQISEEIAAGKFEWQLALEDVHLNIEARLTSLIGDAGKRLHTGRSRNDQVATDLRLYLRDEIDGIVAQLNELQKVLVRVAEKESDTVMPGFTHMQVAQPVTFGHHMLAYVEMFERDHERMLDLRHRVNRSPLGAAALAGTTYPIDREYTAELLGFEGVMQNSLDAVSDRDYGVEFLAAASLIMIHISRLSEELVYWMSQRFNFIHLPDRFTTGSSIMPQKKNPDMAELIRGKVGRVYGDLMQLLTVMKGTALAYNKDFQEDKESLFDAVDTWKATIDIFAKMLDKTEFRMDQIEKQLGKGFLNATDIAEHFAKQGIPFREAHSIVGHMVKMCENKNCDFEDLTDEDLQSIDSRVSKELLGDISIKNCVDARVSFGGTAPSEVRRQIKVGREWLNSLEK